MYREAAQAAAVVRTQIEANAAAMQRLGAELRRLAPRTIVTIARGSSDHAATYAKYLIETRTRSFVAAAAPSLSSVYRTHTDLRDAAVLAISQSGKSPDLLAAVASARTSGAFVIALCNSPASPLAQLAHCVIDLQAGAEHSVAATKSFIASLSAIVHLTASWTGSDDLLTALHETPALLERAWALDWGAPLPIPPSARSLFVVGRGLGLAAAQEAALKLKETCAVHAEAFSAAEVQHGPMALVQEGFPVLAFSQADATRPGIEALARDFIARDAHVLLAGAAASGARTLPTIAAHPVIEPLLMVQSFYRLVVTLALARGLDPDTPPHLRKVTETH